MSREHGRCSPSVAIDHGVAKRKVLTGRVTAAKGSGPADLVTLGVVVQLGAEPQ